MREPVRGGSEIRERHTNRWLAALSLALAVVVWHTIREAISFEQVVRDVPIRIEPGVGMTVLEQSEDTADVWFRGARSDLALLDRDRIRIQVDDIAAPKEGARQTIDLKPTHVRGWVGAHAVRFEPARVTFSVDREGERHVPVRAEFQDTPPEGYEIGAVTCTPATVLLRGPLSRLEDVEVVRTMPIDLQGRVQSFRVRATLVTPPAVSAARIEPDRVSVDVPILEHSAAREFDNVPVSVLVSPGRTCHPWMDPSSVRVQLQGKASVLGGLSSDAVTAFADAAGLDHGVEYELRVQVSPPPGCRVVAISPPSVKLVLRP